MTTMRPTASALLAILALGLGAAGLSGCADNTRLIPARQANALDDQLQQTSEKTLAGDCAGALASLADANRTAATLPASVDLRLRLRIQDGLRSLASTVPLQCKEAGTSGTTTTTGSTTASTTDTTTPSTTDTTTPTTTTTTPTTTTTTPTTTAPPVGGISPEGGTTTGAAP